jgi:hypothetical protein
MCREGSLGCTQQRSEGSRQGNTKHTMKEKFCTGFAPIERYTRKSRKENICLLLRLSEHSPIRVNVSAQLIIRKFLAVIFYFSAMLSFS